MRRRRLILFTAVLALTAAGSGTSVAARESPGTPTSRTAFDRGEAAARAGDLDAAVAAVESNRDEPRYLLRYAVAHEKSDPARFRELALQVVATSPTSPSAAEALYNLANASTNPERRGYLDRLRTSYPVDRFSYSASA